MAPSDTLTAVLAKIQAATEAGSMYLVLPSAEYDAVQTEIFKGERAIPTAVGLVRGDEDGNI